jgi:enamine deaminase RidA (YjgF/YER057c/UK114 family)
MSQPSNTPTSKVTAATGAGAASVLVVFIAGQLGLDVSPEVAAAIATLLAFAGGYVKKENA